MAHYAILSTIHKRNETESYEPGWHKIGYFPQEINDRVAAGYRDISLFLDAYAAQSKRMLEDMSVADATQQP